MPIPKLCRPSNVIKALIASTFIAAALFGLSSISKPTVRTIHTLSGRGKELSAEAAAQANTTIFIITATHHRPERLADLTRVSNTFRLVPNLFWIVVEDSDTPHDPVKRLLERSGIPHVYLYTTTHPDWPYYGVYQKNMGMEYIRKTYAGTNISAVMYIADDDNAYDLRVFDYIRQIKTIGIWAVGLAGRAYVEAPVVKDNHIVGWNVVFDPSRKFAVDMAGFAVNVDLLMKINATFHPWCDFFSPETCFLEQLKIEPKDVEVYGHDAVPQDVLVWHVQTHHGEYYGDTHDYVTEW